MTRSSALAKVRTKSSARVSLKLPGGPDISNMWPRGRPPPSILFTARWLHSIRFVRDSEATDWLKGGPFGACVALIKAWESAISIPSSW